MTPRSPSISLCIFLALALACPSEGSLFGSNNKEKKPQEEKRLDLSRNSNGVANPHDKPVEYGVDVTFPMHYNGVSTNYEWLPHNLDPEHNPTPKEYKDMVVQPLGDKQTPYDNFLKSCVESFEKKGQRCIQNERERIAMTLRQPQSMTNYTTVGFKKIKAPPEVWKLVKEHWDKNKDFRTSEQWGVGNTYTNNWESPTYMVSVENNRLRGAGAGLKQKIWNAAKPVIEEWTGEELTQCSLYGVRIYTEGSILAPHVDRLPLVSSAIINVAQDVDEPWPIEVYGHDGKATNVTMEPGDMVLYESHSVIHGRPFPLKGRYYANLFVHFEPTGHTLRHNEKVEALAGKKGIEMKRAAKEATARDAAHGGHENHQGQSDLPSYILPGSPEETNWRRLHPSGQRSKQRSFATGSTNAHYSAQAGDLAGVERAVKEDKNVVHKTDANGWTPLHEAARAGHRDVVKFLYDNGADVNARTHGGSGGSVLWWTKKNLGSEHDLVSYLEELGAIEVGPEF